MRNTNIIYSLFLLSVLVAGGIAYSTTEAPAESEKKQEAVLRIIPAPQLHPDEYRVTILESCRRPDIILESFRNMFQREGVIAFFEAVTHSRDIAERILVEAENYDVSPSLAFALCWAESRFNPRAVNAKNTNRSIDRGLFQLNSGSFPNMAEEDFFNTGTNARYGVAHLRHCLDTAGSEVAALAMYNAGTNRVRAGGTPKMTLDYVSQIIDFKQGIEELFYRECTIPWTLENVNQEISLAEPYIISAEAYTLAQMR